MNKQHVFTKAFWNKSRIAWVTLVSLCTSIPVVFGSVLIASKWAEANFVSPYIECKIEAVCIEREKPLKQDIKTIIDDMKFVRGCMEMSTPKTIQDKVVTAIRNDSIQDSKYILNRFTNK